MRGSIYYQTSLLAKSIFTEGCKKHIRSDPDSDYYRHVASFETMQTYRSIWNELGFFIREEYEIKDLTLLTAEHVEAFMLDKSAGMPAKQTLEKISAAIGKLETALEKFCETVLMKRVKYDFSIRQQILDNARDAGDVYDGYHNRAYSEPEKLINAISNPKYKAAAGIQYFGGARFKGVGQITADQLFGEEVDEITGAQVFYIETREKGGYTGLVAVEKKDYRFIEKCIVEEGVFKISRANYGRAIRTACDELGIKREGSHGLRWSYTKRRMIEYQEFGYTYEQALQGVSWELKHNRPRISFHYLGS